MRALFALLLLANLAGFTSAQNPLRCVVCQSLISGRYVWFSDPALAARQPICEACWKSEARCALCRLMLIGVNVAKVLEVVGENRTRGILFSFFVSRNQFRPGFRYRG